jgi:hypothetical protein
MQEINLKLAIEDVNVILEGVGNLPFAKVYALVGKIQEQAAQQLRADSGAGAHAMPGVPAAAEAAR